MGKNRYRSNADSFDVTRFKLKVIVIGYGLYGESTLILLMDNDIVFYSIIIDSYQYKNEKIKDGPYINKTIDMLREYGLERVDVLCWTHPHDDHSKGISRLIKKYCDSETKILFPMYLQNNERDIAKYGNISKQNLESIFRVNKDHHGLATPIGVADNGNNNVDEFNVMDFYSSDIVATVRIDAITPISSMLTEYVNNKLSNDPNELSISLVVDINGYALYFGGDTTNKHINHSKRLVLRRCRFVKIPHHSSKTAKDLVNYLPQTLDGVCTTVFRWGRSKLPEKEVVEGYKSFGADVYSTNYALKENVHYGIIMFDYDFACGLPSVEVRIDGVSGVI